MKRVFNLFLVMSIFCASTFQFSPKAAPPDSYLLTPMGKVVLFLTRFNQLAQTYTYDKAFADEHQSHVKQEWIGFDFDTICSMQEHSLNMLDKHHKGVCRNFMFAVERELSNLKIKNWLVFDHDRNHGFNIYLDPIDGQPMVADLTYQLELNENMADIISSTKVLSDYAKEVGFQEAINKLRNSACCGRSNLKAYVEGFLKEKDKSLEAANKRIEQKMNLYDSMHSDPEEREIAKTVLIIIECLTKLNLIDEKVNFDRFYKSYELEKSFS